MKVSFEVGPRNEDYIELARKALNNGGNCDILKQYLCQFMTYSQMADALFYLTGENQELLESFADIYDMIVDELMMTYWKRCS